MAQNSTCRTSPTREGLSEEIGQNKGHSPELHAFRPVLTQFPFEMLAAATAAVQVGGVTLQEWPNR